MKQLVILLTSLFLFSCQQKEKTSIPVKTTEPNVVKEIKEENLQKGDTIFMNSKNDKDVFEAEGSLDSIHPRLYVKFQNEYDGELNAKIIPETEKANIRFNQIIFPDKTSDGPFGSELKINVKQKGTYILVIGHSQMAENPYWGKFKIQLETKKNANVQ